MSLPEQSQEAALGVNCSDIFPGSSDGKASACNVGDLGLIPESGRSPGERNGNPLQNSFLENPTDRGTWQATVHGVTKESDTTEQLHFPFFLLHYRQILYHRSHQGISIKNTFRQARFQKVYFPSLFLKTKEGYMVLQNEKDSLW